MKTGPSRTVYPPDSWSWSASDVRNYALAIGAPHSPLDADDLLLVGGDAPIVFPTFAALRADAHSLRYVPLPGLNYDALDVIYAGHEVEVFGALPANARGTTTTRLLEVGDISAGVLVVREATTFDDSNVMLARNVVTSIVRGATVGVPAERAALPAIPDQFDFEIFVDTLPQQAFLYAQTGDNNPLHLDPAAARRGGFSRPILHGLCTYAMVAHAIVREWGGKRWTSVRRVGARFTSPVIPGDRITVRASTSGRSILFAAWVNADGEEREVLARGEILFED